MTENRERQKRALEKYLQDKKIIGPTAKEADEVNSKIANPHSWLRNMAKKMGQGAATILGITTVISPDINTTPSTEIHQTAHSTERQARDNWAQEQHDKLQKKETAEAFKGPLSFGVIKGVRPKAEKPGEEPEVARARITLERVSELLKQGPVDLVLTPEYSFIMEKHPLRLTQTKDGFEIDPRSDPLQQHILSELQKMAKENRTTIFAGTFNEAIDEEKAPTPYVPAGQRNTLIHINPEGKIIGIKRKSMAPEGSFVVKKGENEYKVLPIICAEANYNYELDSPGIYDPQKSQEKQRNSYQNVLPEWVKQDAPYDLLIHPQRLGDVNFNTLADYTQNGQMPKGTSFESPEKYLKALQDAFEENYSGYSSVLKENAPIVTADVGIAAVFKKDQSKVENYSPDQSFTRASIP